MLLALTILFFIQYSWIEAIRDLRKSIITENIFIAFNESANEIITSHFRFSDSENQQDFLYEVSAEEMSRYEELISAELKYYLENLSIEGDVYWGLVKRGETDILMGNFVQYPEDDIASLPLYRASTIYQQIPYDLIVGFKGLGLRNMRVIYFILFLSIFCFVILLIGTFFNFKLHLKRKKEVDSWIDFIGNMIHEFKTPMSSISLASELIMRPDITNNPNRVVNYASLIYKENLYLKQKMEQLLRSVSLDTQSVHLRLTEVNIHQEIENLVEVFSFKISEKGGELTVNLNASDFIIIGDKMHIFNAISNLLDNAEKYTEGNPKIVIETKSDMDGIHIFVKDNGIGIKQEDLNKLFRKFYRVRSERSSRESGYGLGLFYVDYIMKAHKGYVKVYSKPNKGSVFELYFPYHSLRKK
ncbi:MAG: HAMP domain-containing histidine kinase [Bacteroidales bacterium]|nr:HAMP domain-containing histidine kinase [Bacteroidales bacterium]